MPGLVVLRLVRYVFAKLNRSSMLAVFTQARLGSQPATSGGPNRSWPILRDDCDNVFDPRALVPGLYVPPSILTAPTTYSAGCFTSEKNARSLKNSSDVKMARTSSLIE